MDSLLYSVAYYYPFSFDAQIVPDLGSGNIFKLASISFDMLLSFVPSPFSVLGSGTSPTSPCSLIWMEMHALLLGCDGFWALSVVRAGINIGVYTI